MSPIQQMLLGGGSAVATKTYVDDVFSTFLYTGNAAARSINNGINLSESGGLVWTKARTNNDYDEHALADTERGVYKELWSNSSAAETSHVQRVTSFNSNGYSLGTSARYNKMHDNYASWTFRKAPGFCDIKTWDGNSTTGRQISHDLGCVPGLIMVKSTNNSGDWMVYHRGIGNEYRLKLNSDTNKGTGTSSWNDTTPTSTHVTLGSNTGVNATGTSYVGYFFAGGESTAATARSVDFDGSGDYLTVAGPGALGTSTDFTMECWVYLDDDASGTHHRIFSANEGSNSDEATQIRITGGEWQVYIGRNTSSDYWNWTGGTADVGQWYHLALVRHGTNNAFYVNGVLQSSATGSHNVTITTLVIAGGYGTENINGKVSNARFVNGTAVYTSSFKPPTEPLTSITNTTLLCCNNSSTTGKTTGGTITANGDPTASIDSPFDDSSCFVFGENEDQDVIKCGSYTGNGSSTGPEINLGWEPQWLMVKRTDSADKWPIYDSMRGIVTGGNDARLYANEINSEYTSNDYFELTPTGFKITKSSGEVNGNGGTYIYICIRRSDGYVGKPPSLGTGVFAMDTGSGSSTIPNFDSGFPVDFAFNRPPASTSSWTTAARLTGQNYMLTNASDAEAGEPEWVFDSNVGWHKSIFWGSAHQSWMWKRHAGFDVVTYEGNGTADHQISHSLSKTPEMIWVKDRSSSNGWAVGHKGLNGGTNPWEYNLKLNENAAEESYTNRWNDTAPTSTHFTVGTSNRVNTDGDDYIAMLFASVDGISKVGYYTGTGGTNQTINVGFNPRFLFIKRASGSGFWRTFDTLRSWDDTDAKVLNLDTDDAQTDGTQTWVLKTSTGFTLNTYISQINGSGDKYIYYCHA